MKLGTLQYSLSAEDGRVKITCNTMPEGVLLLDVLHDWLCDRAGLAERKRQEVFNTG